MKNSILLIISIFSAQLLFGWGKNGHLIVGNLADQYLTAKTRAEVKKILGDESIAVAGEWMDRVNDKKIYKSQYNWHYMYQDKVVADNAVIKLEEFKKVLADPNVSDADKLLPMRALIHITADLHVPMHCGYTKDDGGHNTKLAWEDTGEKTNMHKVWDTDMILRHEPDATTYVANLQGYITADKMKEWGTDDVNVWVTESQELLDQAYSYEGKYLTKAYYDQNIPIVDDRLGMAAVRLAYILNSIFDPQG